MQYGFCSVTDLLVNKNNKSNVDIERFHSRDHGACFSTKTKENVCVRIELNSRKISWGHQHGCRSFV